MTLHLAPQKHFQKKEGDKNIFHSALQCLLTKSHLNNIAILCIQLGTLWTGQILATSQTQRARPQLGFFWEVSLRRTSHLIKFHQNIRIKLQCLQTFVEHTLGKPFFYNKRCCPDLGRKADFQKKLIQQTFCIILIVSCQVNTNDCFGLMLEVSS